MSVRRYVGAEGRGMSVRRYVGAEGRGMSDIGMSVQRAED